LEQMGFPVNLKKFFEAITTNANAGVLVNVRPTGAINITRSVRQGCPIAPVLFILALQALDCLIKDAIARNSLRGIFFEEVGVELAHQFYSDNTSVMIRASADNARECQKIFDQFGTASGLKVNWNETAAVLISPNPRPQELDCFSWKLEQQGQYSKLLGFFFGENGIDSRMVLKRMKETLANQLRKARLILFSPTERKVIVNQLLKGSLCYVLTLWKGTDEELHDLEREMINYIWAGQNKSAAAMVDALTLMKSKKEGGIGLISIKDQVKCKLAQLLLWAVFDGSHPLQLILRHGTRELSY
jgi:hypothetical protein